MKRIALLPLIAIAACSMDAAGPISEASLQGDWVLQSVDGHSLPWQYLESDFLLTIRAQKLTLRNSPPGSCQWVDSFRYESINPRFNYVMDENARVVDDCYWTVFDSEVRVNGSGTAFVGTASGRTLTLRHTNGETFVYTR